MKAITQYQADDGSKWDSQEKCIARDNMVYAVKQALTYLKPTPDGCGFNGYVQQSAPSVLTCKIALFGIANQEGVLKWWIDDQKTKHGKTNESLIHGCHPSWFGRMLDGGHGPLSGAYSRLCCIDENSREWEQPYYAAHPGEGDDICVG